MERRSGGIESLNEALTSRCRHDGEVVVVERTGETTSSTWHVLDAQARALAEEFQSQGLGPGSRIALLVPTSHLLLVALEAAWLSGACVSVLPHPALIRNGGSFGAQTRAKLELLTPAIVLGSEPLLDAAGIDSQGAMRAMTIDEAKAIVDRARGAQYQIAAPDAARPVVVQFTSGSTAAPKAVVVSERGLCRNVDAVRAGISLRAESDRLVSWLPLFHDMGLIGMTLLAMLTGTAIVFADSHTYAADPSQWMRWVSQFRASIICAPNFAYQLATRGLASSPSLDLSSVRVAMNGSEPIQTEPLEEFIRCAGALGFSRKAMFCGYGLAEATLAVSFSKLGSGLRTDVIHRHALERGGEARPASGADPDARSFARLGQALPGLDLRIRRSDGNLCKQREVGELEIRGPSTAAGYLGEPPWSESDWISTGDLAYLAEDDVVVCGRLKDVLIFGGRNILPSDVEEAVATLPGISSGHIAAFNGGVDIDELVIAAERRKGVARTPASDIRRLVNDAFGVAPKEVVFLEPGTLPRTTSGKLQRALCAERYRDGLLAT